MNHEVLYDMLDLPFTLRLYCRAWKVAFGKDCYVSFNRLSCSETVVLKEMARQ